MLPDAPPLRRLAEVMAFLGVWNRYECSTHVILPLAAAGQIIISASIIHFDPRAIQTQPRPRTFSPQEAAQGVPGSLVVAGIGMLTACGGAFGYLYPGSLVLTPQDQGWVGFGFLVGVTLLGFHLLWTHFWLVAAGCMVLAQSETGLAMCAVIGTFISIPWYSLLIFQRKAPKIPPPMPPTWRSEPCRLMVSPEGAARRASDRGMGYFCA